MEGFSMILKRCIAEAATFSFHQGCEEQSITHLCFADDLFVFTGGDLASVEVLKTALEQFRMVSGLEPNISKSEVFFSNVSPEDRAVILNCLPFKSGVFPIRYLGVPLSPICLRVADFAPLVNNVKMRVHNWKSKFLSFGGRKQLVTSVLQSMHLYWMMIYVIPSGVVHELESCFRDFLWTQGANSRGKCKIAWETVCKPVGCGGLGFKRLAIWNRAFITKHIWDVLTRRKSLWVDWIWLHCIRNHSFWSIRPKQKWSWIFRKILKIRPSVRDFFYFQVGTGMEIRAWEDTWLEAGPLSSLLSYRRYHNAGFDSGSLVRDVVLSCNGSWPHDWVGSNPQAFASPLPQLTDMADLIQWKGIHGLTSEFTIREAWKSLSGVHPSVHWTKYVWFKGHIPKHGFCVWTACHGRLPTQDRIALWKHDPPDLLCVFCGLCIESHDHIFFSCSFTHEVWRRIKREVGLHGFPEIWSDIVQFLNDNRGPKKLIHKLALSGTVYFIWRERNRRVFNEVKLSPIQVFKQIRELVLSRMASWKLVDIAVSMINPEPEDLPKKHIPRLDLVCEGVHEDSPNHHEGEKFHQRHMRRHDDDMGYMCKSSG
ncbi:hypothetical protein OSB04_un001567 [Centaurea solstitialis]|uniref:Reverse transcriptase zinc-binding domain-containing protein n=1 Tax=Centaurea solstitialis TaxID=347529 RepID=A0AA38W1L4_9ASTR|nr:hypothetical protein OSB04_un001567 [Centaurea solstitialis]